MAKNRYTQSKRVIAKSPNELIQKIRALKRLKRLKRLKGLNIPIYVALILEPKNFNQELS